MISWIINAVLLIAVAAAARYCWKKFRRGECIGCSESGCNSCAGGCCHCHDAKPKTK